jgi:hypothetical protein
VKDLAWSKLRRVLSGVSGRAASGGGVRDLEAAPSHTQFIIRLEPFATAKRLAIDAGAVAAVQIADEPATVAKLQLAVPGRDCGKAEGQIARRISANNEAVCP